MIRTLTEDELLNLIAGLPPSVMAMDAEETITTLAATVIEQQAEIERLREALDIYAPKPSFMIEEHDQ